MSSAEGDLGGDLKEEEEEEKTWRNVAGLVLVVAQPNKPFEPLNILQSIPVGVL
jgi:hypothetical protein